MVRISTTDILEKIEDPKRLNLTQKTVLPTFIKSAIQNLRG